MINVHRIGLSRRLNKTTFLVINIKILTRPWGYLTFDIPPDIALPIDTPALLKTYENFFYFMQWNVWDKKTLYLITERTMRLLGKHNDGWFKRCWCVSFHCWLFLQERSCSCWGKCLRLTLIEIYTLLRLPWKLETLRVLVILFVYSCSVLHGWICLQLLIDRTDSGLDLQNLIPSGRISKFIRVKDAFDLKKRIQEVKTKPFLAMAHSGY